MESIPEILRRTPASALVGDLLGLAALAVILWTGLLIAHALGLPS